MKNIKEKWRFSKWRFYYKNLTWNVQFYLFSKKRFKDIEYTKGNDIFKPEKINKHRFVGYEFKGRIYLDNPGFNDVESEVLKYWKGKGYF